MKALFQEVDGLEMSWRLRKNSTPSTRRTLPSGQTRRRDVRQK
jgi:hypothetical protein